MDGWVNIVPNIFVGRETTFLSNEFFTNKSQSYIHRTQSRGVNRRLDSPWTLLNTFTSV